MVWRRISGQACSMYSPHAFKGVSAGPACAKYLNCSEECAIPGFSALLQSYVLRSVKPVLQPSIRDDFYLAWGTKENGYKTAITMSH